MDWEPKFYITSKLLRQSWCRIVVQYLDWASHIPELQELDERDQVRVLAIFLHAHSIRVYNDVLKSSRVFHLVSCVIFLTSVNRNNFIVAQVVLFEFLYKIVEELLVAGRSIASCWMLMGRKSVVTNTPGLTVSGGAFMPYDRSNEKPE